MGQISPLNYEQPEVGWMTCYFKRETFDKQTSKKNNKQLMNNNQRIVEKKLIVKAYL